jgi:hypothetical protein
MLLALDYQSKNIAAEAASHNRFHNRSDNCSYNTSP